MKFRAIALDLDGTLLDPQLQILPANQQALHQARTRGIEVLLVTGRHHIATRAYHHQLGLDTPAVCCNGIYLHDFQTDAPLRGDPLTPPERLALLALARREGLHALAYLDDRFCFESADEPVLAGVMAWAQRVPEPLRPVFEQVADLQTVLANAPRVWKLAISLPDPTRLRTVAHEVEHTLGLGSVQTGPGRLDIGRAGHSKASGLSHWLATHGIAPAEVIAFGDNHNDISMLQLVGHGVAMAGAPAEVQAVADEVCGAHGTPAIAAVLQRLLAL
jgi:Cof subfamily protein (haloacid dehalogenase superfamily)